MAKCSNCGRKGLFFKVNEQGLCNDCAGLKIIEQQKNELDHETETLKESISELRNANSVETAKLNNLKQEYNNIYDELKSKAEADAISAIQDRIDELNLKLKNVSEEHTKLVSENDSMQKKYYKMKTLFESYQNANKQYLKDGEQQLDESFFTA